MKAQLTIQLEKQPLYHQVVEIETTEIVDIEIFGYYIENQQITFGKRQLVISTLLKEENITLFKDDIHYLLEEEKVTGLQVKVKQKGVYLSQLDMQKIKLSA